MCFKRVYLTVIKIKGNGSLQDDDVKVELTHISRTLFTWEYNYLATLCPAKYQGTVMW